VPRAAQTWEVPVHTPDILAAAWAVEAYVEGYFLTGRDDLLAAARYFAAAGLPFVYTWGFAERPVMPGGSIPVFGATWYTGSWFATPVQWNGFVYAHALYRLARIDQSFPWRSVALAITRSGFRQEYASGPHLGLYPDSWDLIDDHANPVDINPEGLLRTLWFSYDRELEAATARVPSWRGDYLVDAVAAIEPLADPEGCSFKLRWFPGQTIFFQVRGPRVDAVTIDGKIVPIRPDVDAAAPPVRSQRNATSWIVKFLPESQESLVAIAIGTPPGPQFRRGDANADRATDLADAIKILGYLFAHDAVACGDAADANDDGKVDIADAVFILSYLFAAGPDPPPPFPACGRDGSADGLDCAGESGC